MKPKKKTDYYCPRCKECDRKGETHPGMWHAPGICDCPCRDEGKSPEKEAQR